MNTIHDMGGMDGFGPVERETDEPVFHADWERRAFALALAAPFAVPYTDDNLRPEIERIPPAKYLTASYYEKWLLALESLLRQRGVLTADGKAAKGKPRVEIFPPVKPADVAGAIAGGFSTRRPEEGHVARFKAGDRVRARNIHPAGHTRLVRYVRGRQGVIDRVHGVFTFADTNSRGDGERPQYLYAVRFAARELWGADASPIDAVCVDLWDSYLDLA
ncbi:MAG: nitrile hydratase subunit beta [Dongiaceae bacterium]